MNPTPQRLLQMLLGVGVTLLGLLVAVLAVGPVLRLIIGVPDGFATDYTSKAAYAQAVGAQCVSVALSFFAFGVATRRVASRSGWRWAIWAANPLTVSLAYWCFREIGSVGWPYEYRAYHGWLVLTLLSPFLFAPCASLGLRMVGRPV